jgi:hypothetical protein
MFYAYFLKSAQNMNIKEDITAHAWGMYDETEIFPALCCHGFVLVVVNMMQSGEL